MFARVLQAVWRAHKGATPRYKPLGEARGRPVPHGARVESAYELRPDPSGGLQVAPKGMPSNGEEED